ncbi:hypothetical protein AVEN_93174-1 [Araneus ventricosus]|uniref:Uncharacterized protein n=1 Tax=Araneus ventricosus TaxID=182803 RepID=A0A4Y2TMT0_ARAVE|nr:hypothetical protein AVEN_93174-1 [Araneus ventricosus]
MAPRIDSKAPTETLPGASTPTPCLLVATQLWIGFAPFWISSPIFITIHWSVGVGSNTVTKMQWKENAPDRGDYDMNALFKKAFVWWRIHSQTVCMMTEYSTNCMLCNLCSLKLLQNSNTRVYERYFFSYFFWYLR